MSSAFIHVEIGSRQNSADRWYIRSEAAKAGRGGRRQIVNRGHGPPVQRINSCFFYLKQGSGRAGWGTGTGTWEGGKKRRWLDQLVVRSNGGCVNANFSAGARLGG